MRIFISHSSKDKEKYCNQVVQKLAEKVGLDSIVYDAITFEAGEKSLDEIIRTLSSSDLYVILLSSAAVESPWVKFELSEAQKKLSERTLDRIYPLIIDSTLGYADTRIPEWLKEYNLKYIARPAKAAKLIIERAKNINWTRHPESKQRSRIFVGRNELIQEFEERIDNFDKIPVNTFIVSGLPNIGRKSLAYHCLIKGSIIPQYYEFPAISLSYQESIEDFIIKVSDLGFTDGSELNNLALKSIDEKTQCAIGLAQGISSFSEILMIKDDGCIIDYRGNISDWFKSIISARDTNGIAIFERVAFVIITKYKTNFESIRNTPSAFYINTPELSQFERKGLLRRLAEIEHLQLTRNQLESISVHLTGYPAQVRYAVEVMAASGYTYLSRNFKMLTNYSEQEVSSLLEKHAHNSKVFEILALVARYDAISINMLYDILEVTPGYIECYEVLFQESFFELEGVNKEYIRLNEVVRNYILRSGAKVCLPHRKKADELFETMFSDNSSPWYNSNDFLLAIRETVVQGKSVSSEFIIPSVFLKSMTDLYSDMQYENVIRLAKRALENSCNIDGRILYEIRYLLCSALAKMRSKECLDEIQQLNYDDRKFLAAFYYRQVGKNDRALSNLNDLLSRRPDMSKAKREKVLVLKNLQQFEEATGLAKENYYQFSDNPYHIQAYFECLINTYYTNPQDKTLEILLDNLGRIHSEKAQSMHGRCKALYQAYVDRDVEMALQSINNTISNYPTDRKYALIVKFDIARLFHQTDEMKNVIKELEQDKATNNSIVICRSKYLADQNQVDEAIKYFLKNISFFTEESKKAFCEKLQARVGIGC